MAKHRTPDWVPDITRYTGRWVVFTVFLRHLTFEDDALRPVLLVGDRWTPYGPEGKAFTLIGPHAWAMDVVYASENQRLTLAAWDDVIDGMLTDA